MNADNFWQGIASHTRSPGDRYAEELALYVARAVGISPARLRERGRELYDDPTPRLRVLESFEEAPLLPALVVSRLVKLYELSVADLFRLERTPLVRAFQEAFASLDTAGRYRGIVFSWPQVDRFMCLHDLPVESPPEPIRDRRGRLRSGVRIQASVPLAESSPVVLTLESLDSLLRRELGATFVERTPERRSRGAADCDPADDGSAPDGAHDEDGQ